MVKPDGIQRGHVGEIISRFEKKGFHLTALKMFQCAQELPEVYSGPVICMAWEGVGVVASARKLIRATNPLQAGEREIGLWFGEGEICQWTQSEAPWLQE